MWSGQRQRSGGTSKGRGGHYPPWAESAVTAVTSEPHASIILNAAARLTEPQQAQAPRAVGFSNHTVSPQAQAYSLPMLDNRRSRQQMGSKPSTGEIQPDAQDYS